MDLVLKYLPLIIFIYPILSWLDSRKRFTHNAKFYSDRAVSVKKYEEECAREGIKDHEKSAFAQALAATDKLGFRDIDIIKLKFPDHLFIMIGKIQKIKNKITIEKLNDEDVFVAYKSLKKLQFRPFWYLLLYVSSIPIFISNNLLVMLFNKLHWKLIVVDANTYLITQLAMLLIGISIAITAAMKFINNDVLVDLIKKENLVMSKDEYEREFRVHGE
ncbi:hypothetical protein AVENLUH5627_03508 [Acinetobacter venetianus]|uniref:Uncharacterized protein n=1 Tax=Acinetobacter venetianus TaxID=52133 RepID=A0A150HJU4_9GAMM|nr:hypothetical protein [Acinetobacter venetianus]KXZ62453.1 hypothetical protein AVENLUH5627_03508 [Acinetobacter venetianus]